MDHVRRRRSTVKPHKRAPASTERTRPNPTHKFLKLLKVWHRSYPTNYSLLRSASSSDSITNRFAR